MARLNAVLRCGHCQAFLSLLENIWLTSSCSILKITKYTCPLQCAVHAVMNSKNIVNNSALLARWSLSLLLSFCCSASVLEVSSCPGPKRENNGRCIADLEYLADSQQVITAIDGKCHWSYTFKRARQARHRSLLELDFSPGEFMVLSIEGKTLSGCFRWQVYTAVLDSIPWICRDQAPVAGF